MASVMSRVFDCSVDTQLLEGMRRARTAIKQGKLVVIPTDTVYGIAADAFTPKAVQALLDAKGRGRQAPPPVLIPNLATMTALAEIVPPKIREVAEAFWPGGLTIILDAQPSLAWDLGDTAGTVAIRVPQHPLALELLQETGPLAVSSANLTGQPAAQTAKDAKRQLGDSVEVYLDGGSSGSTASTIIDATGLARGTGAVRIVRDGAVSVAALREILGEDIEPATAGVEG